MLEQLGIFCLGASAVLLANDSRPHLRRWGCVFGCIVQPLWFHTAWVHGQWGVFAGTFIYAFGWLRGFYNQWVKR